MTSVFPTLIVSFVQSINKPANIRIKKVVFLHKCNFCQVTARRITSPDNKPKTADTARL